MKLGSTLGSMFGASAVSIVAHTGLLGLLLAMDVKAPEPPLLIEVVYVEDENADATPPRVEPVERPPPPEPARKAPRPRVASKPRAVPPPVQVDRPDAVPTPGVAEYADAARAVEPLGDAVATPSAGAPIAAARAAHPPVLVRKEMPEYPSEARRAGITGEVVLAAVLDPQGRIEDDIAVLRSVAALDQAAIRAVKQWRFQPATDASGQPIRVSLEIPIRFTLR